MYNINRVVIFADKRFNRPDKKSKLPPWVLSFLRSSGLNISTEVAIEQIKIFLKVMGQPVNANNLNSILLTELQVLFLFMIMYDYVLLYKV